MAKLGNGQLNARGNSSHMVERVGRGSNFGESRARLAATPCLHNIGADQHFVSMATGDWVLGSGRN